MTYLLSFVIFLPLIGATTLMIFGNEDKKESIQNIKVLTMVTTLATFIISLALVFQFDPSGDGFQFSEDRSWIAGLRYKIGVDGISLPFVILTTFLMPIVIVASWNVDHRVKDYMVAFLFLESLMIGVFCALDIILFYVFFEAGLIPMFIIIGIWGGKERIYATFKFFLYTLLGSILMLVAIVYLITISGTTDIEKLHEFVVPSDPFYLFGISVSGGIQTLLWLAFFASFAVKMPMWPFHTWLPDAHVQAPTGGSMVLAAILLKMGGYGFLRFSLPLFPEASIIMQDAVFLLSVIAIIYTSLVALVQDDIKKLIAYSSVAHMGFVTIGIFSMNHQGIDGAIFQMISHGIISAALFFCVGVIYDRTKTRLINDYGGLVSNMPKYALFFMLFTMANVGLPGTSGFIGEFLSLLGAFKVKPWFVAAALLGVVLSAAYGLSLYKRIIFGNLIKANLKSLPDLSLKEMVVFIPLAFMTVFFGIFPYLILDLTSSSVSLLIDNFNSEIQLGRLIRSQGLSITLLGN